MKRLIALTTMAVLLIPSTAAAHQAGRAIPKIEVRVDSVASSPLVRHVVVTLVDADSPQAIDGATVRVEGRMTVPHDMSTLPVTLAPTATPGEYAADIRFPMAAAWTLTVRVEGATVQEATAEVPVEIQLTGGESNGVRGEPIKPITVVKGTLTWRDVIPATALFLHAAAAIAWIALVLVLVYAAHPRGIRNLTPEFRERVLRKRSPWRLGALVSGVVVVATGFINGVVAAPFRVLPVPEVIAAGLKYPFGGVYLGVLLAKLIVFAMLVFVNRIPPGDESQTKDSALFALRADTVLLPMLLAAVVLLRYVHILSHVAQAATG